MIQTQDKNMIVARLAADLMNKKIYTKVKRDVLDLYTSRDGFYKKARFDVAEQMARMGIRDRKTYESLVSILSSYSDEFTVGEMKAHFFYLFLRNTFESIQIEEDDEKIAITLPGDPNNDFLTDMLSFGDYLVNLCEVDLLANLGDELTFFMSKGKREMPPLDIVLQIRQFCSRRLGPFCKLLKMKAEKIGDSNSDKNLITGFYPNTPFYDVCFYAMRAIFEPGFISSDKDLSEFDPKMICDRTIFVEAEHIIHSSLDKMKGNIIANEEFRSDLRNVGNDENRVNCLAVYASMCSWLVHSMIGGQKYADDIRILETTHLTKQEIRKVIASTLLWADRSGIPVPEDVMDDATVSSLLANDMVRGGIEMVLRKNRKECILSAQKQTERDEKVSAKAAKKDTGEKKSNGLERVIEENRNLKLEEQKLRQDLKSKKDIEKKMKGEMSEMKKDFEAKLKKLRQELEKTKAENEELQKQLDDDEFASDEEQVITKEDVLSAAEGKKVLVWGIRPEIAERLTSEYPDIVNCIIMEDGRQSGGIPNGALEKVDAAIIVTNFSSHGMYYKARDEIKASGVPYAHARKNVNSPDRFGRLMWKVLTGIDNRNLKE